MASYNEAIITYCLANGATSTQYNTALLQYAIAEGATAGAMPNALQQVFTTAGYTGAFQEQFQQWLIDNDILAGGPPAPTIPITGDFVMTVAEVGASRGSITGAGLTPQQMFWMPDAALPTKFSVNSSGTLLVETDNLETWNSEILVTFPGHSATPIRCLNDDSVSYTRWRANGETALYTYFGTEIGNDIDYTVDVHGNGKDGYLTNDLHFHPVAVSSTNYGFNSLITPGTYDPGKLAVAHFPDATAQPIKAIRVSTSDLLIIDNDGTSGVGTSLDLSIPGFNSGTTITLPWASADWRITGGNAAGLYTYLGTVLDTTISINLVGPY